MNFELLDRLRPDYFIDLDLNNRILSVDHELLTQVNPNSSTPSFNLPVSEFFNQFNKSNYSHYTNEFISNMSYFIENKTHALIILNSNLIKKTQSKGIFLFIVCAKRTDEGVKLEFFNLIYVTELISKFLSYELWQSFKTMIEENRHCFINQQLFLAYQAILPLFLLTNTSEVNIQAKPKWNELGELLFYFNPYSKNKQILSTSGRNLMSDGLPRSENEIVGQMSLGLKPKSQKLIHGNQLTRNHILILN